METVNMPLSSNTSQQNIVLNCFEGQPAPPIVIEGWKQLNSFPRSSWDAFWLILAPVLLNPENATNPELVRHFARDHDISPDRLMAAMGCCELLLRQAAALDLPEERFQQDLEALGRGGLDPLGQFILSRFPDARKGLRQQILMESLAAHGKVMTGLQWRLDTLRHSSKGNLLNTDVVMLTLSYREGTTENSITLQLTEESARQLTGFCNRFTDRRKNQG
jgi:hypothetical protein